MSHVPRLWDLFCHVVDNFGDAGVCWRLAADLGARGERVRLWIDDPAPLRWMAPHGAAGVEVVTWSEAAPWLQPGDVVVEAFGCDPPAAFVARMAGRARPPVWVNLEYLSAEAYVERSHALPSPQRNGLTKWFFFPGFTALTGGLLREPALAGERRAFNRNPWLAAQRIAAQPGERLVSLFCYDNAALPQLLQALASTPTLILATPGHAQRQLQALPLPPGIRVAEIPWLAQPDFDRLLWSCDLNFVRGEDSLLRAVWAAAPFVWQIYPQHDDAHVAKLDAFLDLLCAGTEPAIARGLHRLFGRWNGVGEGPLALPPEPAWSAACTAFCGRLLAQTDLATQLIGFVSRKG